LTGAATLGDPEEAEAVLYRVGDIETCRVEVIEPIRLGCSVVSVNELPDNAIGPTRRDGYPMRFGEAVKVGEKPVHDCLICQSGSLRSWACAIDAVSPVPKIQGYMSEYAEAAESVTDDDRDQ